MTIVTKFFRWIRQVSWNVTSWVFFWKHKAKSTILGRSGSKKHVSEEVETSPECETFKLVQPPQEAELPSLNECPGVPEPYVLATTKHAPAAGREGRSLLWLPCVAVRSVSTLMLSTLRSGWRMCRWKSPASSASTASQMRTRSSLVSQEAEMLREVYLVLWAIRKQLRQLARRQDRHRRRHVRTHASRQSDSAQVLKQDARSPL